MIRSMVGLIVRVTINSLFYAQTGGGDRRRYVALADLVAGGVGVAPHSQHRVSGNGRSPSGGYKARLPGAPSPAAPAASRQIVQRQWHTLELGRAQVLAGAQ